MTEVADIPRAHTPEGGYGREMPPPVLAGCVTPLGAGLPDLRGTWRAVDVTIAGEAAPPEHPIRRHVERIEQAGDRVVITAGGVVHDMVADGTVENGVHDVLAVDFATPIVVAARFEDGVLVLRPQGLAGVEVRRWRDGEHLLWQYHDLFTARLARVEPDPEGQP
jgi:hypothetical protein